MMSLTKAYEEVVDFIAAGSSPASVADFRPSEEAQARVSALVSQEKTGSLTTSEAAELEHYFQMEHLMRLAKARARLLLAGK